MFVLGRLAVSGMYWEMGRIKARIWQYRYLLPCGYFPEWPVENIGDPKEKDHRGQYDGKIQYPFIVKIELWNQYVVVGIQEYKQCKINRKIGPVMAIH